MGRRPKDGRPETEAKAMESMRAAAQRLLVVPTPAQTAATIGEKPATIRAMYRKLLDLGDLAQTDGGVYYLPDEDGGTGGE